MSKYAEMLDKYDMLNKVAQRHAAVFFGADWLCEIPISELARDNGVEMAVYNRSIKGLTVKDAEKVIDTCVLSLCPNKLFINIGENDLSVADYDGDDFVEKYEWLLYTIYSKCKCDICILSVICDESGKTNDRLKELAKKHGCKYIDINSCQMSIANFFRKIRFFLRNHPISFYEAMQI